MRTISRLVFSAPLVALIVAVSPPRSPAWAQQPRVPPGSPVPAATGPQPAAAPSVTAAVQQYLLNPHGEVDGLLLADGTVVKFPPHLGVAVASTVKPGDGVAAVGFLGQATAYGRAMKALTITNTTTGQTVVDQPPPSRPLPPHLRGLTIAPLTVSGTVAHFLVNPAGDIDGLVLATGEQVKFKPHNGALIQAVLGRGGGALTASGHGTRNAFGTVVDAESVTIGAQTLSLRGPGRR